MAQYTSAVMENIIGWDSSKYIFNTTRWVEPTMTCAPSISNYGYISGTDLGVKNYGTYAVTGYSLSCREYTNSIYSGSTTACTYEGEYKNLYSGTSVDSTPGTILTDNLLQVYSTNSYLSYMVDDNSIRADLKRYQLKSNLRVIVKSRVDPIAGISAAEAKAIETLREMISESDYRRYVKNGFLLVRGESGDMYQVYRQRAHTKVWRDGVLIEEICVRIKDSSVPPTDHVIAFKTMIEADEESFKGTGNRYKMYKLAA